MRASFIDLHLQVVNIIVLVHGNNRSSIVVLEIAPMFIDAKHVLALHYSSHANSRRCDFRVVEGQVEFMFVALVIFDAGFNNYFTLIDEDTTTCCLS